MSKNLFTGQCPSIPSIDGTLICPVVSCGIENTHLADCRTLKGERGSIIEIDMFCECGHVWTYRLKFHKGVVYIETEAREGEPAQEMWRD